MYAARSFRSALFGALAIASLAACGDNPAGPNTDELDVTKVAQAQAEVQAAMNVPAIYSLVGDFNGGISMNVVPEVGASASLSPLDGATSQGARIRAAAKAALAATGPSFAVAGPDEAAPWYVDPSLWGYTFVKDPVSGELAVDESRTDAPDRGVRIVLYQRTGPETFSNTVVGALDVIDSSTTTMSVARINIYNTQDQLVGSFRDTQTETGTTTKTVASTFHGTFGVAPKTFVVADTMTGTITESDTEYSSNLRWRSISKAAFANAEFSMLVTGLDLGAEGESGEAEIIYIMGGHTTRMVTVNSSTVVANIYIDGELVATVVEGDDDLRGPNGGTVSPRVEQYLMAVSAASMYLPNATAIRFAVMMSLPYFF